MMWRITAFLVLVGIGLFLPFWLFMIAAFAYALYWKGYELLIIAVSIDVVFGVGTIELFYGFFYTLVLGVVLVVAMLIQPYVRLDRY